MTSFTTHTFELNRIRVSEDEYALKIDAEICSLSHLAEMIIIILAPKLSTIEDLKAPIFVFTAADREPARKAVSEWAQYFQSQVYLLPALTMEYAIGVTSEAAWQEMQSGDNGLPKAVSADGALVLAKYKHWR